MPVIRLQARCSSQILVRDGWLHSLVPSISITGILLAANQRHLEGLRKRDYYRPPYRVCVAGIAICIFCIVTPRKPQAQRPLISADVFPKRSPHLENSPQPTVSPRFTANSSASTIL